MNLGKLWQTYRGKMQRAKRQSANGALQTALVTLGSKAKVQDAGITSYRRRVGFSTGSLAQAGRTAVRWLWAVLLAMLAACAGLGVWLWLLSLELPDIAELNHYRPHQPLRIYTQDGVEIGQFGVELRYFVPIKQIPTQLQNALLAVEDTRFREHPGVDLKGVARAVVANLRSSRSQGASTITQQVARNFYLTARKDYRRKVREILLALKIERQLSKDQILELYMNQIYLGQRTYGFEAAAKTYFGKSMGELTLAESAMLAGLPQNPSHANPVASLERARKRQLAVLERMRATQSINEQQYQSAKSEPLQLQSSSAPPPYARYVVEMVRQAVHAQYGDVAYTRGLKVTTALNSSDQQAAFKAFRKGLIDLEMQQPYRGPEAAEELADNVAAAEPVVALALANHMDDEDLRVALVTQASPSVVVATLASGEVVVITEQGLHSAQDALRASAPPAVRIQRGSVIRVVRDKGKWNIAQWPQSQGALVALEPQTGYVRALIGGFDFGRNPLNYAEKAWRQAGSVFKPFLYSAALEQGVMPSTLVNDAPLTLSSHSTSPQSWQPENADGKFDGPLTLRQALEKSKNLISIRLVTLLGVDATREWVRRFGFDMDKQPKDTTLALGTGLANPMQLASSYSVFANGGHKVDLILITRVTDSKDQVLFEAPLPQRNESNRVISARNAFITSSLLRVTPPNPSAAAAPGTDAPHRQDLYGVDGAHMGGSDSWFAGFAPDLLAVVWLGHEGWQAKDTQSISLLSRPIWFEFMQQALHNTPQAPLAPPPNVSFLDNEWIYGERANGDYVMRLGFDKPPEPEPLSDPNNTPSIEKSVPENQVAPSSASSPSSAAEMVP